MDAFVSGGWRTPTRGEVLIGGAWRRLTRGEVYRSGAWKQVVAFISPLSVSAFNVSGLRTNRKPTSVQSQSTQATPTGGLAPYSYAWATLTGNAAASNPSLASTSFTGVVGPEQTNVSTARVTCTDALGNTATADITITLTNDGTF